MVNILQRSDQHLLLTSTLKMISWEIFLFSLEIFLFSWEIFCGGQISTCLPPRPTFSASAALGLPHYTSVSNLYFHFSISIWSSYFSFLLLTVFFCVTLVWFILLQCTTVIVSQLDTVCKLLHLTYCFTFERDDWNRKSRRRKKVVNKKAAVNRSPLIFSVFCCCLFPSTADTYPWLLWQTLSQPVAL